MFLNGEAQLEIYLQEHSLDSCDLSTAKKELQGVVETLNKIVTTDKDQKVITCERADTVDT